MALGCADPVGDYEEYTKMAQGRASPPPPSCLPTPPAEAESANITGTFIAYCKVNFAAHDQSLLLAANFTQNAEVLDVSLTPLKVGATTINDTAGDAPLVTSTTVSRGQFTVSFDSVSVSGAANKISGQQIVLSAASFKGVVLSKDRLMAELDGTLVKPFESDLTISGDICLFYRLEDGKTLPTFQVTGNDPAFPDPSEFKCVSGP